MDAAVMEDRSLQLTTLEATLGAVAIVHPARDEAVGNLTVNRTLRLGLMLASIMDECSQKTDPFRRVKQDTGLKAMLCATFRRAGVQNAGRFGCWVNAAKRSAAPGAGRFDGRRK
ncbi:hypothetical protein GN244_ATG14095 [Phytophthora infestans]|uniref:Uncharacterized protein n=1 Tax=Phytophthora infestans TaxID=4787 RepID=A0A833SFU4_PHYIN|nr:hypothetical protein GN244_ATG14095 [Phytophthora infestans]